MSRPGLRRLRRRPGANFRTKICRPRMGGASAPTAATAAAAEAEIRIAELGVGGGGSTSRRAAPGAFAVSPLPVGADEHPHQQHQERQTGQGGQNAWCYKFHGGPRHGARAVGGGDTGRSGVHRDFGTPRGIVLRACWRAGLSLRKPSFGSPRSRHRTRQSAMPMIAATTASKPPKPQMTNSMPCPFEVANVAV